MVAIRVQGLAAGVIGCSCLGGYMRQGLSTSRWLVLAPGRVAVTPPMLLPHLFVGEVGWGEARRGRAAWLASGRACEWRSDSLDWAQYSC